MRNLLALFALLLGATIQPALAADTTPPTCKIISTVIAGSTGSSSASTYFSFYIKAADETQLAPYSIEYRARVNNISNNQSGFRAWAPYVDSSFGTPLTITVQCTSFQFEVRAVDAAGNRSPAVVRRFASPFPLTPAVAAPRFSAAQKILGGTAASRVLGKFDFDEDGNTDIAVADQGTGVVTVRRNTEGDGKTFTDVDLPFLINGQPTLDKVAAGRLVNKAGGTANDTLPDIAVTNNGNVSIEVNQGVDTGGVLSFTRQNTDLVSTVYLKDVAVADLNGDGFDDVIATGDPYNTVDPHVLAIFLNQNETSGGFAAPVLVNSNLSFFYDLQIADLNGDGFPDVAVCGYARNGPSNKGAVEVFLNDQTGHFTRSDSQFLEDYPSSLALGDVTGDGIPDLAATIFGNYLSSGTNVRAIVRVEILENNGDGTFKYLHLFPLVDKVVPGPPRFPIPTSVAIGDTNFDGKGEIVAACDLSNVGKLFQLKTLIDPDNGSVFLSLLARSSSLVFGGPVRALAFGDLDGNFKRDIYSANTLEAKPASLLLNLSPGVTVPTNFKLSVTGDTKITDGFISGWDFNFSTILGASAAGLQLRVQSTTLAPGDPNREASWTDLPGGGYLTKSSVNNWKLTATDIPTGVRYFRVIASSHDFPDFITKDVGPFNITAPAYIGDVRIAEVLDDAPKIVTGAFKDSYTLKVERGNTGVLAVKVTNNGSYDKFLVKVPRSALNDHFRTLVSPEIGFEPLVSPAQPTDSFVTLETPYLHHLGTYTFYLKARVAVAAGSEIGGFDIVGKPSADTTTDTANLQIKASDPKNVFFVTNTSDGAEPGPAGSLRRAIFDMLAANLRAKTPAPIIKFEIPTSDANYNSGTPTITLTQRLLPIAIPNVAIDGRTQNLYEKSLGLAGDGLVVIRGDSFDAKYLHPHTPAVSVGLEITSGGCRIERLIFRDMEGGIRIAGAAAKQNVIRNCGFAANRFYGILIEDGASKNIIGGGGLANRNYFMSVGGFFPFGDHGIWIRGNNTDGNKVQGNLIGAGLPASLGVDSGMQSSGVLIQNGAQGNLVGGTNSELRNIIVYNGLSLSFAVQEFGGVCISGPKADGNLVQGNYIGVTEDGLGDAGNEVGVYIKDGASNNLVGGTDTGAGNVISGSTGNGVSLYNLKASSGDLSTSNRIAGNIIGLDANGNNVIANAGYGVEIDKAPGTIVGGTTAAARNIISGNGSHGVFVSSHANSVQGNYIGTDITGQFARPNAKDGINVLGGNLNLLGIGKTNTGANLIAYNTGCGIKADTAKLSGEDFLSGYRNGFRGNSIFGNGKLGIDLVGGTETPEGVTDTDSAGPDAANEGQNHPYIYLAAVTTDGRARKTTNVVFRLLSVANTIHVIDFYASDVGDPSGYGEGQQWLGSVAIKSDADGEIGNTFRYLGDLNGKVISATATRTTGSTSEFSNTITVTTQISLVDNADPTKYFVFNAVTGDYEFHDAGGALVKSGRGTVTRSGNIVTLTHNTTDRKITAKADITLNTGIASCQPLPGSTVLTVIDGYSLRLDDANDPTKYIRFHQQTGDYQFHYSGGLIEGRGTIVSNGNTITLTHSTNDRFVTANFDLSTNTGTASYQVLPSGPTYSISDNVP